MFAYLMYCGGTEVSASDCAARRRAFATTEGPSKQQHVGRRLFDWIRAQRAIFGRGHCLSSRAGWRAERESLKSAGIPPLVDHVPKDGLVLSVCIPEERPG